MTKVMMKLGQYKFSMRTAAYQKLKRSNAYRWASQLRIGRGPALQFMGPGEDTIELDGTILPGFYSGTGQVDAMRDEAKKGQKLMMVDGHGKAWGWWVIKQVEETGSFMTAQGVPRKIEFRLMLSAYGGDK